MSSRLPGSALEKLLSKRVRPLALVCALFVVISLGVMSINAVRDSTADMQERLIDLRIERDQRFKEYRKLQNELEIVGTDDYIIAKARQIHGYIMPNELLFVIRNPEVLYEESDEPIRMAVVEELP